MSEPTNKFSYAIITVTDKLLLRSIVVNSDLKPGLFNDLEKLMEKYSIISLDCSWLGNHKENDNV